MSLNDATTPLIEGMLRAIVADDPFALWEVAEEWALRHERLSVLYGYFALLGVVGVVLGWTATALSDVDESEVAFVVRSLGAHAALLRAVLSHVFRSKHGHRH